MDVYVSTGHAPEDGIEKWEAMSLEQRFVINEVKKVNPTLNNEVISAVLMTTFIEHCKILKMNKEQIRNKFVTGLKLYFEDEENG